MTNGQNQTSSTAPPTPPPPRTPATLASSPNTCPPWIPLSPPPPQPTLPHPPSSPFPLMASPQALTASPQALTPLPQTLIKGAAYAPPLRIHQRVPSRSLLRLHQRVPTCPPFGFHQLGPSCSPPQDPSTRNPMVPLLDPSTGPSPHSPPPITQPIPLPPLAFTICLDPLLVYPLNRTDGLMIFSLEPHPSNNHQLNYPHSFTCITTNQNIILHIEGALSPQYFLSPPHKTNPPQTPRYIFPQGDPIEGDFPPSPSTGNPGPSVSIKFSFIASCNNIPLKPDYLKLTPPPPSKAFKLAKW